MVLIAASIFTKSGKLLLSRQFVSEMTRSRLEGLLDAFPKLIGAEKGQRQHTFVETDSVRYVYQPLDQIYMVLVTTTNSNIMEDLETLRLFSRIIPEYCRSNDESEILANCFELIFAFDEVVVLGYRESVNLAQIRTFTEMDSHEERVFNQIQIAQQRAAKSNMQEKVKEMKREAKKKALGGFQGGYARGGQALGTTVPSGTSYKTPTASSEFSAAAAAAVDTYVAAAAPKSKSGGGKALKLGAKAGTDDAFYQQLRQEGVAVADVSATRGLVASAAAAVPEVHREPLHLKLTEKVTATVKRDGQLQTGDIFGNVTLNIAQPEFAAAVIKMKDSNTSDIPLQTHPHLDKNAWQNERILRPKSVQKPFPVNLDVAILKWRIPLKEETDLPLTLNVWPNESPSGCSVNIEYTLQQKNLVLDNVQITIPLPTATAPVISECEGTYEYLRPKNSLIWNIPVIDETNETGTLEFEVPNGDADHFFPVNVSFSSEKLFCKLSTETVTKMESNEPIDFSTETRLTTDKYEIV